MSNCQKNLWLGLIFAFVAMQVFASLSKSDLYPFSPYRMFSRHWPSGVDMERVRFKSKEGKFYRSWDLLNVPFFLSNHLSFVTFLDPSSEEQKLVLCRTLLEAAKSERIEVLADLVKFERVDGVMKSTPHSERIVYVCKPQ